MDADTCDFHFFCQIVADAQLVFGIRPLVLLFQQIGLSPRWVGKLDDDFDTGAGALVRLVFDGNGEAHLDAFFFLFLCGR